MSLSRRLVIVPAAVVVSLTAAAVAGAGSCTHPLFAAAVAYAAGDSPRSVAIGDLDGVNGPDLAVAIVSSGDVSVLLSLCTAQVCPWDLDGDGGVEMADLQTLIAQWRTDPGGPPDFDGDGDVAVPDLLQMLARWGPCP